MSGHSKWATTKHKKAAIDAKRSSLFSKLSRNITVAAKLGGDPNPDNNATLAAAVARRPHGLHASTPRSRPPSTRPLAPAPTPPTTPRSPTRATAPAGVAVYVDCLTDNKNRTAADVRSAFSHSGGSLGTSGSVAFQFERKGSIARPRRSSSPRTRRSPTARTPSTRTSSCSPWPRPVARTTRDAGEEWIVWTAYDKMQEVQKGLEAQGIEVKGSELTMVPHHPDRRLRGGRQEGPAPRPTASTSWRMSRTSTTHHERHRRDRRGPGGRRVAGRSPDVPEGAPVLLPRLIALRAKVAGREGPGRSCICRGSPTWDWVGGGKVAGWHAQTRTAGNQRLRVPPQVRGADAEKNEPPRRVVRSATPRFRRSRPSRDPRGWS